MNNKYCIGIDYGSDSVRALLVDTKDGKELASAVFEYPRWKKKLYCKPEANLFRQHPLDYLEGLESTIHEIIRKVPEAPKYVCAISIDTTGSTPVAVNQDGTPLALLPGFEEDPDAMFILWKDHSAVKEAEQINRLCKASTVDYSNYVGGIYSAEWFWAKILYVLNNNEKVAGAAYSWVEHCDWMPALLTGNTDPLQLKRCRSTAGHKALWHPDWDGLPPAHFLSSLHPALPALKEHLYKDTYTSDVSAGTLSPEWAKKLGLCESVVVGVGAMDSHFGFVGGQIEPYTFCKVIGTSTVDMVITPPSPRSNKPVRGICGQANGSVVPGMISYEAGQSAFGDVYAWFVDLLLWPLKSSNKSDVEQVLNQVKSNLLATLNDAAAAISPDDSGVWALDWLNGRRTPDANYNLKGAIMGLSLGSDAPKIYKGLVEATAFGSKKIFERFKEEEIPMKEEIIVMGGVAKKSPFVLQTLADVLGFSIKVVRSENVCALGAAMFAAVAGGIYPNIREAQEKMGSGFDREYHPIPQNVLAYQKTYEKYKQLGSFIETLSF